MKEQYDHSKDAYGRIKHSLGFFYYLQGGLDSFCGIYSLINALNYFHWKNNKEILDKISEDNFELFLIIKNDILKRKFQNKFGESGFFGGDGLYGSSLIELANIYFKIEGAETNFKENSRPVKYHFRDESLFKDNLKKFCCLVWITEYVEEGFGKMEHWIVTIPEGYVLDSLRGITRWNLSSIGKMEITREFNPGCDPEFKIGSSEVKHVHSVIALGSIGNI